MKRFVLLFFALLGYSLHATGQEQRIAGFIYATDPTEAIPFASLWLYDPATGEPEYGTLTSANGYYEFDAIATNRTYRLEISGPGIGGNLLGKEDFDGCTVARSFWLRMTGK